MGRIYRRWYRLLASLWIHRARYPKIQGLGDGLHTPEDPQNRPVERGRESYTETQGEKDRETEGDTETCREGKRDM